MKPIRCQRSGAASEMTCEERLGMASLTLRAIKSVVEWV